MKRVLCAAFAFGLLGSAVQANTLSLTPSFQVVDVGNQFSLSLDVDLTDSSQGGRFFITYDPAFVQFDDFDFTPNQPWNDEPPGTGLDIATATDDGVGAVEMGISAGFQAVSGMFDIGTALFTLVAAPTPSTMIGFDDSTVPETSRWGLNGNPIGIAFEGASIGIPVPAVAYLFPAGLIAGLGWMRRRSKE